MWRVSPPCSSWQSCPRTLHGTLDQGTETCLAAVEAKTCGGTSSLPHGPDADLNAVDAFNLALLMHDAAPAGRARCSNAPLTPDWPRRPRPRQSASRRNARATGLPDWSGQRGRPRSRSYDLATALLERGNMGIESAARLLGGCRGRRSGSLQSGCLLSGRLGLVLWAWAGSRASRHSRAR